MKQIKETGIFLLFFMSIIFIGTSILFFMKLSISRWYLPVFFGLTSISYSFYRKKESKREIGKTIIISFIIIAISMLGSSFLFDRSSDGNTYHKDAIGILKEGWNPVYQDSRSFIENRKDDSKVLTEYSIWSDHYAKANWILAANFSSFTNHIETGKAMNMISVYIVFSFIFSAASTIIDPKKSLLLSIITVINPITASQLFTYYNDQLVCLYLFLSVFFLIQLDHDIKDKETWLYYSLSFILLSNMKFNGLGYLLVFSFLFVCRYLYKAYQEKKMLFILKKLCMIFIPLFIISLVVVGYPTYIKNTLDHSNPFFPLYDKNGEDIITQQQPRRFQKMNNLEKLFYGTFSKTNNLREHDKTEIKIPFTIYKEELVPATSNDLRISGFGLFFSGLLIISIFIFIKYSKEIRKESWIFYVLGITVLLLLVMSESWWARYTAHFYFFILLSVYFLFKNQKNKYLTAIYVAIIVINSFYPLLANSYYTAKNSIVFLKDARRLKNHEIIVSVNGMNGCLYNLKDFHISYQLQDDVEGKELYYHYLKYQEK